MEAAAATQVTRAQLVAEMCRQLEPARAEQVLDQALEQVGLAGQTHYTAAQVMEIGIAIISAQQDALQAWADPRAADCEAALGMAVELMSEEPRGQA